MNENGVEFTDRPADFVDARDTWFEGHLDQLDALEPVYSCTIVLATTLENTYGSDCPSIEFEEYTQDGNLAAGRRGDTGAWAFGSPNAVISALSVGVADEAWVGQVVSALDEDRARSGGGWRRHHLEVFMGSGTLAHATSRLNRESIRSHGLDWSRMDAASGIAGSRGPEIQGIFLDTVDGVSFFVRMPEQEPDVWIVDVQGLWLESGPDGWWLTREAIDASRLRLADPEEIPRWSEARAGAKDFYRHR